MGLVIDKISGQVFLFTFPSGTGSTTGGTTSTYPEVNTFAQLPNPALNNGKIYIVRQASGSYILNRKEAGLYYSNSIVWSRLGDIPAFFNDDNFQLYDGTDNTKQIRFQLSGITASNQRVITLRDSNGTIAYLSDLGAKVDVSAFATYTGVTAPSQFVGIGTFQVYTGNTATQLAAKQNKIYIVQLTSTGSTNVNSIVPISINWNTLDYYDTNYFFFSGGSRIYLKASTTYEISFNLQTTNVDFSEKVIGTVIKKNGSVDLIPYSVPVFVGSVMSYAGSNNISKYKFSATIGDYIELKAFRIGQSGTINTVPNGTWIKVEKI